MRERLTLWLWRVATRLSLWMCPHKGFRPPEKFWEAGGGPRTPCNSVWVVFTEGTASRWHVWAVLWDAQWLVFDPAYDSFSLTPHDFGGWGEDVPARVARMIDASAVVVRYYPLERRPPARYVGAPLTCASAVATLLAPLTRTGVTPEAVMNFLWSERHVG